MRNSVHRSTTILRNLLLIAVSGFILYTGRILFIPLMYGLFIAILLFPFCRWLEGKGFSKRMAVFLSLLLLLLAFVLFIAICIIQIRAFMADLPSLKEKLAPSLMQLQLWLTENFQVSAAHQHAWTEGIREQIGANVTGLLSGTFKSFSSGIFILFITPVFASLFLYNRSDFVLFLYTIAGNAGKDRLHHVLGRTVSTYYHFIRGMAWVYFIVGLLNSAGLLALGIRHAFLFGFITAIMTIIPYIGIFVSALLPVTVAWITKDSIFYPIGVVGVFVFVQYLEANIIFPRAVAGELEVSTWATLIAMITGGILWGVNGMILFIPLIGIVKLMTDFNPEWQAVNLLLRRKKHKAVNTGA